MKSNYIKRNLITGLLLSVVLIYILVMLFPYIWMVLTAFKYRVDAFSIPPKLIFNATLENFKIAFIDKNFILNFKNSLIVVTLTTFFSLLLGLPSAYAFSRFHFKGDRFLYFYLLGTRFTPIIVLTLPLYLIMNWLNLTNTYVGITIAHTTFNLVFVVWMMKGFFDTVPLEVDEAARVDGCSWFKVFLTIALPLTKSGIAATAVFCSINSWNEFLMALVLAGRETNTLTVAIPGLLTPQGTYWGQIAAVGTVITLPIFIFAILVQRHMIKGMTMGAIK